MLGKPNKFRNTKSLSLKIQVTSCLLKTVIIHFLLFARISKSALIKLKRELISICKVEKISNLPSTKRGLVFLSFNEREWKYLLGYLLVLPEPDC